ARAIPGDRDLRRDRGRLEEYLRLKASPGVEDAVEPGGVEDAARDPFDRVERPRGADLRGIVAAVVVLEVLHHQIAAEAGQPGGELDARQRDAGGAVAVLELTGAEGEEDEGNVVLLQVADGRRGAAFPLPRPFLEEAPPGRFLRGARLFGQAPLFADGREPFFVFLPNLLEELQRRRRGEEGVEAVIRLDGEKLQEVLLRAFQPLRMVARS